MHALTFIVLFKDDPIYHLCFRPISSEEYCNAGAMSQANSIWATMGITSHQIVLLGKDDTDSGLYANYKFFDGGSTLLNDCGAKVECLDTVGQCL